MGIVLLSPTKKEGVINLPLIKFHFLSPDIKTSNYDLLIFTSKTAVESINKIDPNWKKIPSITVGQKTAKEVENFGGKVSFIGNGYGESILEEISNHKDKKILFIRGKEVANDLKEILKDEIVLDEAITYETQCTKPNLELEDDSVIIFTSPSTVKCFFENYKWRDSFKAVAIGETTKREFPLDLEVNIPKIPSFDECIKLAKNLSI